MKRAGLVLVVFCVAVFAYARDFEESWVEKVADYIEKGIYDIPLTFTPLKDGKDGYVNLSKKKVGGLFGLGGRDVAEYVFANKDKKVEYAFWYMDSWLGGDEKKEMDDIRTLFSSNSKKYKPVKGSEDEWTWEKSGGWWGIGAKIYKIGIYRDSSDGSACVLVQKEKSNFQRRWKILTDIFR